MRIVLHAVTAQLTQSLQLIEEDDARPAGGVRSIEQLADGLLAGADILVQQFRSPHHHEVHLAQVLGGFRKKRFSTPCSLKRTVDNTLVSFNIPDI